MTSERDIERVLDHWFAERPTQVADRVLDEVADRIGREPRRPAWLPWRATHMLGNIKPLAAVAAVIVIAVVGFAILRPSSGSNVGGAASAAPSPSLVPSRSPSAAPSASPSASAVFPSWFPPSSEGAGILSAGTQTTRTFLAGSTFTVPVGWVNDTDNPFQYALFPDSSANETHYPAWQDTVQNMLLTSMVPNNMFAICDATGLFQGSTAAEIVDGIVANEALSTSDPVDITIGGLSGREVDVQINPDWSGTCALSPEEPARHWMDHRGRIIVLDRPVAGTIGIGIGSKYSADFGAFLAEAMPVIESFQFDLTP